MVQMNKPKVVARFLNRIETVVLAGSVCLSVSCSSGASTNLTETTNGTQAVENTTDRRTNTSNNSSQCEASLWDRVYNPSRLKVLDPCKAVTGTIEELDHNEDGDTHMLLKLDSGFEDLLLKKNLTKKNGDLVIEVVCANEVTDKKVGDTCKGYSNNIKIPNVGDHVVVAGSYVNDSHNGWAEIHPVSRIEKK